MNEYDKVEYIREKATKIAAKRGEGFDKAGGTFLYKYKGKYYKIRHDLTGNEFFFAHTVQEITKDEARDFLIDCSNSLEEANSLLKSENMKTLNESEFEAIVL